MKQPNNDSILLWMIWALSIFMCKGHPRGFIDFSNHNVNNNTDALQKLLQVFGLERNFTEPKRHPHPPQYMLDLYRTFSEGQSTDHHFRHPNANTVRSFFDKGTHEDRYHFDIDNNTFFNEEIIAAEFHFFCDRHNLMVHPASHIIQVLLYESFPNFTRNLLEARLVSVYTSGWEVFKVTSSIKKWLNNRILNNGLLIETLDSSGREWITRKRFPSIHFSKRPILIVYSSDKRRMKTVISSTSSKLSQSQNQFSYSSTDGGYSFEQSFSNDISMRSTRSAGVTEKGQCARHELRVDFEKLGWSTWIISPKWYDAYVCSGTCAFPLGQNQRPTNHATVQSIVHELGLVTGVEAPCCVPTELHSVSLLYFDEHTNVVLKQYEDMIAAGCGCQ